MCIYGMYVFVGSIIHDGIFVSVFVFQGLSHPLCFVPAIHIALELITNPAIHMILELITDPAIHRILELMTDRDCRLAKWGLHFERRRREGGG